VTATATQDLSRFDLDFALTATAVTVNGAPATTSASGTELVVTPARPIADGARMTVRVRYAGTPSEVRVGGLTPWIRTPTGALAVNEPEIAAWWFPSNDHPRDKATYDITATVPAGHQVISNGVLRGTTTGTGTTTWSWRESRPMATYLAFVAIGTYDLERGNTASGLPYLAAFSTDLPGGGRDARASIRETPAILDWGSRTFGPYPFDAAGGVVPDGNFGFALENQTRPVYSAGFFATGPNRYVVVHELAHQWYGDSVSVDLWRDIWLNEGFATMAEWLYSEHLGEGTAQSLFDAAYRTNPADSPLWAVGIGDPGPAHLFDGAVYDRGAMTLQALRNRIGDGAFFRVLRRWATVKRYGNGSIGEFTGLAEAVSGQDLRTFFRVWLYTAAKPAPTVANGIPATAATAVSAPASLARIRAVSAHRH
jgi:aminopeptidase N